jgi:hypothetical protein
LSDKDPRIVASVYVSNDEEIAVGTCDVALNPITIRIGGEYSVNTLGLYMSLSQARRLMTKLQGVLNPLPPGADEAPPERPNHYHSAECEPGCEKVAGEAEPTDEQITEAAHFAAFEDVMSGEDTMHTEEGADSRPAGDLMPAR